MVAVSVKRQQVREQVLRGQQEGSAKGGQKNDLPPPAPEHYRVLKEMIIRSSFFYSLETLFNSASLPFVEMAHTTLDDFILLQGDASQVDFTPLFPVILSLCRRGFTDHEGFFSRFASKDDKARRHGSSGAGRLLRVSIQKVLGLSHSHSLHHRTELSLGVDYILESPTGSGDDDDAEPYDGSAGAGHAL